MFPAVVSAGHSAAGDVDFHSAADTVDAVGSGCTEGTNHDSTDWVVPGTSIRSLAEDWCADGYYSQRLVPEASSSWPPFLCAYCQ